MIKKILIGIDDSAFADNAAKYGFNLAETLGAQVGLVHIIEPVAMPSSSTGAEGILGTPTPNVGINDLELLDVQNDVSENMLVRTAKKYGAKYIECSAKLRRNIENVFDTLMQEILQVVQGKNDTPNKKH